MKKYLLLAVFALAVFRCNAQQFFSEILYLEDLSGIQATCISRAPDSTYIIAGYTSPQFGVTDLPMILRIDKEGNCLWAKKYSTGTGDMFQKIIPSQDNSFIVTGITADRNLLVGKFSLLGEPVWIKKMLTGVDIGTVNENTDHSLIITASSNANNGGRTSAVVMKTDGDGNIEWSKSFSAENLFMLTSAAVVPGNDIILYGTSFTDNPYPEDKDGLLVRLNADGDLVLSKKVITDPVSRCYGTSILSDGDSLVLISEHTLQYNSYASVIKSDLSGNIGWSKKTFYGGGGAVKKNDAGYFFMSTDYESVFSTLNFSGESGPGSSMRLIGVDVTDAWDGGYMVCGNGPIFLLGNTDYYGMQIGVYKLDDSGNGASCVNPNISWTDSLTASFSAVNVTSVTESITTETIQPPVTTLVSMKSDECIEIIGGVDEKKSIKMTVTPNPVHEKASVILPGISGHLCYEVSDPAGRTVLTGMSSDNLFTIDVSGLQPGLYIIKVTEDDGRLITSGKILKQ